MINFLLIILVVIVGFLVMGAVKSAMAPISANDEPAPLMPKIADWLHIMLTEPILEAPVWTGDVLSSVLPGAPAATVSSDPVKRWASLVVQYAMGQIETNKVLAVIQIESSGNPNAQNPSDPSSGLMGVTPLIGRIYGLISGNDQQVLQKLFDPSANIKAGVGFLLHLQSRYASKYTFAEWVIAYNAGEANFDKGYRNSYGANVQSIYQELNA